ncbi:DUF2063 domain-containing protein [Vibrio sp. UCD-FRSSP16_10]|uniref:HvfC/BufC N-terminal domain-containing protein n=1 Tax=unclassified Vibrio TaxID=2614977 RepID=UPI0007FD871E|nr:MULTISPECIES: DNA-binding domain-containing protein [unclassified Vibrio]OBT12905.1 DUF2063 domain-containing protein [Vibrio sp. UCD-FRSSP16_30]OBT18368.1 DUF2063 domain-containing protein [Vibrio sp. UCD-FRSSP16_10]
MISLADLQKNFAHTLINQSNVASCDIHSDHFSAELRMQIYRNNVIHNFTDVLKAMYPNTLALIGDECFEQIARQHVITTPSLTGNVSYYGQGFDKTILLFPKVIDIAPYLTEVARFEAACDLLRCKTQNTTTEQYQPLSALCHIDEHQQPNIQLVIASGGISFESRFAIFDLISAITAQSFDDLDLTAPQQGYIIVQPNGHINFEELEANSYQLLVAIESQFSLSEIEPQLLPTLPLLVEKQLIIGFSTPNNKSQCNPTQE